MGVNIKKEVEKALSSFIDSSDFRNNISDLLTNPKFEEKLASALKAILHKIAVSSEFKAVVDAIVSGSEQILDALKDLYELILTETLKLIAADDVFFNAIFGVLGSTFDLNSVSQALKAFLSKDNFLRVRSEVFGLLLGKLFDKANPGPARTLLKAVLGFLLDQCSNVFNALDPLGTFSMPRAVSVGPREAVRLLADLNTFKANLSGDANEITDRLEAVVNSLKRLVVILMEGSGDESSFLFGLTIDEFDDAVADIYNGQAFDVAALVKRLIDPSQIFDKIADAFTGGNFWSWTEFPNSAPVGAMHSWINENVSIDERRFRLHFIAKFDEYFRRRPENGIGLVVSDERSSTELVIDLVTVFFDAIMTFIFDPVDYPDVEDDWDSFEDIGSELGAFASMQVNAAIRVTVGSVLRGVWVWSVENANLIEGVGAVIAAAFSSLMNGVIRHVFWSVRVISVYRETQDDTWRPYGLTGLTIAKWESKDAVTNATGVIQNTLGYAVVKRGGATAVIQVPTHVLALLKDYGAYLDMMYYSYLRRGGVRKPPSVSTLAITRAEIRGTSLTVEAQVESPAGGPRVVVRLYAAGTMYIMTPVANDTYVFSKTNFPFSSRIRSVVALSSTGSNERRDITRI
jgi:hypothetical protein